MSCCHTASLLPKYHTQNITCDILIQLSVKLLIKSSKISIESNELKSFSKCELNFKLVDL